MLLTRYEKFLDAFRTPHTQVELKTGMSLIVSYFNKRCRCTLPGITVNAYINGRLLNICWA